MKQRDQTDIYKALDMQDAYERRPRWEGHAPGAHEDYTTAAVAALLPAHQAFMAELGLRGYEIKPRLSMYTHAVSWCIAPPALPGAPYAYAVAGTTLLNALDQVADMQGRNLYARCPGLIREPV